MAQTGSDEDLVTLAEEKFTVFRSEEEKKVFETFFQNTQYGQDVDLMPQIQAGNDSVNDPVNADSWGKERSIKPDWINWLCTDPRASAKVTSRGISIKGARIDGEVNLAWATVQFPLQMFNCSFKGTFWLNRASLRSLQLQGSRIEGSPQAVRTALAGNGLTVENGRSE